MLTPFSGLSLVIHLIIIGVATLFSPLLKKKEHVPKIYQMEESRTRRIFKLSSSILILIIISTLMIVSFALALRTSIREGEKERHMQYIREEIAAFTTKLEPGDASAETITKNKTNNHE